MKFKPYSREELELFPVDIYSEIPKNDICRFINDIVNALRFKRT